MCYPPDYNARSKVVIEVEVRHMGYNRRGWRVWREVRAGVQRKGRRHVMKQGWEEEVVGVAGVVRVVGLMEEGRGWERR